MSEKEQKQNRVKQIIDDAAKALGAEGVRYFIGAIDRQPKEPDGGKAYASSDIKGDEMVYILDMAFPTRQDLKNLGIYIGSLIISREQQLKKDRKK